MSNPRAFFLEAYISASYAEGIKRQLQILCRQRNRNRDRKAGNHCFNHPLMPLMTCSRLQRFLSLAQRPSLPQPHRLCGAMDRATAGAAVTSEAHASSEFPPTSVFTDYLTAAVLATSNSPVYKRLKPDRAGRVR